MSHNNKGAQPQGGLAKPLPHGPSTTSHNPASKAKSPIQYSVVEMKRKLTSQLDKDKCEIYLKVLAQMLTGDLSKAEFDKQIKGILTEEQRKLHNLFIITILRSAYGSITTTNTQRRNIKVTPLVPRLGNRSREISNQPIWTKIRAKMTTHAKAEGMAVDNESVNAAMMGLEHHIKSILSLAQPSRLPQRIQISPIVQHLAKLDNRELLNTTKKGDITARNINAALAILPNALGRKRISTDDDMHCYHVPNHFALVHRINAAVDEPGAPMNEDVEEIEEIS